MIIGIAGVVDSAKTVVRVILSNHPNIKSLIGAELDTTIYEYDFKPYENYCCRLGWGYAEELNKKGNSIKLISLLRDPRVAWLITEHKPGTMKIEEIKRLARGNPIDIESFVDHYNGFINHNTRPYEKWVKSENLFKNPHKEMSDIFNYCGFEYNEDYMWKDFKPINDYITLYDFMAIFRYRKLVRIEEIDYITEKCEDYLIKYNYPVDVDWDKELYPLSRFLEISR